MILFPHLGEAGSAAAQVLLVVGAMLVLPQVVDRTNPWHRVPLFAISFLLGLRYGWWRLTETLAPFGLTWDCLASWSLAAIEMLALLGSLSGFVLLMRTRHRAAEVERNLGWWRPGANPRVAILIATYNEELEVLERTIVGALALNYHNKEVLILDDGRRDWLRDYCVANGVRYLRRDDNKGSKAGNINNALRVLGEDPVLPDFIAVLDADFVPHRGFITRSLALFHDETVGLVQTPQHFFNADPVQHNLGLSRSYPDEQRFFFDHMQASRDAWGIAICCGTSSMMRWSALQLVGGFPTDSVTEDFLLSVALQSHGLSTAYLNEPLTEGLAPEGLKEYVTQRARWCLGQMQILRSHWGPLTNPSLRLRDRWSLVDAGLYWTASFPFRVAGIVYPLAYWYFNIIVVDAQVPEVLSYFGVYFLWTSMSMNIVSRGLLVPVIHDVSQLLGAIPISRAALIGLLRPHGHPFSVTAKGGDRSRTIVQWQLMMPWLVLLVLTMIALWIGIFHDGFAYHDAGDGKAVVLFWTFYNLLLLSVTVLACIELPRREQHIPDTPERSALTVKGRQDAIWIAGLTRSTAWIRGQLYPIGTTGTLRVDGVGEVKVRVLTRTDDGVRLTLEPDEAQKVALMERFYTDGDAPGVVSVAPLALLNDLARRLSFSGQSDRA